METTDKKSEAEDVLNALKEEFGNVQVLQVNAIGPTLGQELFKNSIITLLLAFAGIIIYLTFRFQFDYSLFAFLALVHDALFILGFFSILGLLYHTQVDALFITAILTVIGFSVHDTIVVYDRIRENNRFLAKKMSFGEIANISVNQTLMRSIATSVTTLLTLLALFFLGGETTKDFVLVMILGITIGTYSSIFFCSMLVDFWNDRKQTDRKKSLDGIERRFPDIATSTKGESAKASISLNCVNLKFITANTETNQFMSADFTPHELDLLKSLAEDRVLASVARLSQSDVQKINEIAHSREVKEREICTKKR